MCNFVSHASSWDLTVLHLVYETKKQKFDEWKTVPFYKLNYVTSGVGVLHTQKGVFELSEGDVFFCLPSTPYAIESGDDFCYAYVSYLGGRAARSAYQFGITDGRCVFCGFEALRDLWLSSLKIPHSLTDLQAEGLILCTLAAIGAQSVEFSDSRKETHTAKLVKKYIDDNFSSHTLTLIEICDKLSYNSKYISRVFKREFGISFKRYLNTVRLNNARALFDKGFTSVKEVAVLSGFSDPLYFSKLFKSHHNVAPSEYAKEKENKSLK